MEDPTDLMIDERSDLVLSIDDPIINSSTYTDSDALVISISIAFFIFGCLSNIRKSYHIIAIRRKFRCPRAGRQKRINYFELHTLILFASNVLALTSYVFFALSEIFPSSTICRWRSGIEAVFRFATPIFLLLLITSKRPRDEIFDQSKWRIAFSIISILALIIVAAIPFYIYGHTEWVALENATPSPDTISNSDPTVNFNDCHDRVDNIIISYLIFIYSIIFGYLLPTSIFILKSCMFNMTPFMVTSNGYTDDYRKYVINLTIIWILCWTPYWTMEIFQFFFANKNNLDIPKMAKYFLQILPTQISYICFPLPCPKSLLENNRNRSSTENRLLNASKDDLTTDLTWDPFQARESIDGNNRTWIVYGKTSQLSPLSHPVSTLMNITLSLTCPLIAIRTSQSQTQMQVGDIQHVRISLIETNEEENEDETFL